MPVGFSLDYPFVLDGDFFDSVFFWGFAFVGFWGNRQEFRELVHGTEKSVFPIERKPFSPIGLHKAMDRGILAPPTVEHELTGG